MPTKSAAWLGRYTAQRWFTASSCPFAICPITQGTLLRLLLRVGEVTPETGGAGVTAAGATHDRFRTRHLNCLDKWRCSR